MPDYERIFDQLSIDYAKTPEDKAYARGMANGKSKTRIEIAILLIIVTIITIFLWYVYL